MEQVMMSTLKWVTISLYITHLCMGNFRLPLVYYSIQQQESQTYSYNYGKLLRFMALRVQLIILASAFVAGSRPTPWWVSCLPHVVLRAQLFVKVRVRPRTLWCRTHSLGHGPSMMVWVQIIWETEVPQFGPGTKNALLWGLVLPRSQLFVKMGARAPCPMESASLKVTY